MTALNFPDSPSNGDTYQGYTYNSAKNAWAKPESSSTTVVANVAALPTSASVGDQAFVTATNRLYLWAGTGWYNIALINNNPTISGVSATYDLAIDGTATTVTITASDPEGLPITYSIVSDTSGNTATVTQGTGANTNVFTITPSTNTAHAGTFSLTFRASDGVNIASSAASFTLQFKVVNQKYTTALITSVGANNATNKSFTDSSSNTLTVTGYNQAHNTTFSPFRHGGYSTYFDGTTDYITVADSAEHEFGTGDFSMEFWWWPETVTGNSGSIHIMISAPNNSSNQFIYHESNYWYYQSGAGGATVIPSSTGAVTAKAWNHVVLCRSGTTMSIFNNGSRTATVQSSAAVDFSNATIGRYHSGGYEVDGYVRDMRWLKGSSAYDATQTSITLPTEPLTAVTNTKLLTCHLPYIADGSTTGHSIAINGNTKTEPFAPYDAQEYSAADHSSSLRFDQSANNDYVIVANDNSVMDLGSAFTLECWFWTENRNTDVAIMQRGGGGGAWNGTNGIYYGISFTSNKIAWISAPSSGSNQYMTGTTDIPLRQWNHVAVSYNGTTTSVYLNGEREATSTQSYLIPTTRDVFAVGTGQVNGAASSTNDYTGNIAEFRLSNSVRYDPTQTTLTVPTAPFTSDSDTGILLKGGNGAIIDKAQVAKAVKLVGNAKSSTTQTKFLSSSMYFDGTGDYINAENFDIGNVGTAPFTFEGWFYLTASPVNYITIMQTRASNASTAGFVMAISASDFYVYSGAFIGQKGSAISSNQWYHWAYTRDSSGNQRVFLDGTQTGSTYTTARNYTEDKLWIGAKYDGSENFTGYQSDIRITKGLARYTANFTPPTAALQG